MAEKLIKMLYNKTKWKKIEGEYIHKYKLRKGVLQAITFWFGCPSYMI